MEKLSIQTLDKPNITQALGISEESRRFDLGLTYNGNIFEI
jgi:hypothetical protein